jgi:predicted kinase
VAALLLVCRTDPEVARRRLAGRAGDVSDADWAVYQQVSREWEKLGPQTQLLARQIASDGSPEDTFALAATALRAEGLAD